MGGGLKIAILCAHNPIVVHHIFNLLIVVPGCREVENALNRHYRGKRLKPVILPYHKAIDPNILKTNLKYTMPLCCVNWVVLYSDLSWWLFRHLSSFQAVYETQSDPSHGFGMY